jgi:hypothetical protein
MKKIILYILILAANNYTFAAIPILRAQKPYPATNYADGLQKGFTQALKNRQAIQQMKAQEQLARLKIQQENEALRIAKANRKAIELENNKTTSKLITNRSTGRAAGNLLSLCEKKETEIYCQLYTEGVIQGFYLILGAIHSNDRIMNCYWKKYSFVTEDQMYRVVKKHLKDHPFLATPRFRYAPRLKNKSKPTILRITLWNSIFL